MMRGPQKKRATMLGGAGIHLRPIAPGVEAPDSSEYRGREGLSGHARGILHGPADTAYGIHGRLRRTIDDTDPRALAESHRYEVIKGRIIIIAAGQPSAKKIPYGQPVIGVAELGPGEATYRDMWPRPQGIRARDVDSRHAI